jgi:2-oxoisovalerate ferredoxin oxidoreductase beta subunit
VQDRVIFCSPVGCSVFAYYYFDTGNVQCAHGRAPAVATGLRRANPDSVIICYQGDGDLAGIGLAEILHAANRGERLTVFFVNNAIYGMTGGQMAPTTLPGQVTATTPKGRSPLTDGSPIRMAELVAALEPPVYVARVSLADPGRVLKARQAVRQALRNQIEGRGFSFVEILSPCPVNWRMDALEARRWMVSAMEPVFPLGVLRDTAAGGDQGLTGGGPAALASPAAPAPVPPLDDAGLVALLSSRHDLETRPWPGGFDGQAVKIAGFGGQGVLSAGVLLADCAITAGLHASWLPSYGPEMRGGTAYASVIVSAEEIGSPLVDRPSSLIALNGPSADAFEDSLVPDGLAVVNSSMVARAPRRSDIRWYPVPATEMAAAAGFRGAANVVALSAWAALAGFPSRELLEAVIPHALRQKRQVELNLALVKAAFEWVAAHPSPP